MDIIDPTTPVYNTIIFYILVIAILLLIKPKFMYCHKSKQFKAFGCGENKTLLSFPLISISFGIILYILFLAINIIYKYLD